MSGGWAALPGCGRTPRPRGWKAILNERGAERRRSSALPPLKMATRLVRVREPDVRETADVVVGRRIRGCSEAVVDDGRRLVEQVVDARGDRRLSERARERVAHEHVVGVVGGDAALIRLVPVAEAAAGEVAVRVAALRPGCDE